MHLTVTFPCTECDLLLLPQVSALCSFLSFWLLCLVQHCFDVLTLPPVCAAGTGSDQISNGSGSQADDVEDASSREDAPELQACSEGGKSRKQVQCQVSRCEQRNCCAAGYSSSTKLCLSLCAERQRFTRTAGAWCVPQCKTTHNQGTGYLACRCQVARRTCLQRASHTASRSVSLRCTTAAL